MVQATSDMQESYIATASPEQIKQLKEGRKKAGFDPTTGEKIDPFQAALEASRKRLEALKNKKFEYKEPDGLKQGGNMIDPSARFERLRQRAKQEQSATTQQQKEALQRRFAALGQLGSGADIKTGQLAEEAGQKQLGRVQEGIRNIEEEDILRRQEIKAQREFQASEAAKGRQFAAEQAEIARQAGLEQLGVQQEFAAEQAKLGRDFQSSEALAARTQQAEQWQKQFDAQADQFEQNLKLAKEQFAEEIRINNANLKVQQEALNDPGLLGSLIDDIFGKGTTNRLSGQGVDIGKYTINPYYGQADTVKNILGF